jgi:hypothetical protein
MVIPNRAIRRKVRQSHGRSSSVNGVVLRKRMLAGTGAGGLLAAAVGALIQLPSPPASAQSPSPNVTMEDVNSYDAYPSGANAVVVEALGMIGSSNCDTGPYEPQNVTHAADTWINENLQVIIEITPQTSCDSNVSDYENAISEVVAAIAFGASSSSQFNRYFGGVMLDEEPWYGYAASTLESLNAYLWDHVVGYGGTGKLYSESANAPGWWSQSTFEGITWGSSSVNVPAPQVYNANMAGYTNQGISDTGTAGVDVTCTTDSTAASPPWNSCSYAPAHINDAPWQYTTWGNGYWLNKWQPA